MPLRPTILLVTALLGLTQCIMQGESYYPVQPMPDATQTGANTAGCVVDGLPWVANLYDTTIGVPVIGPVTASWDNVSVHRPSLSLCFLKNIADEAQVHNNTKVELEVPGVTRPGTFVLDQQPPRTSGGGPIGYASFTFYKRNPNQPLLTGPGSPGRMVVTRFDTLARVVSGTFEFTARAATGAATGPAMVRVTEGRFDCKF